jgi:3-hydroxybutyryl-CoA dehydrogenase
MQLAVIANDYLKTELCSISPTTDTEWIWLNNTKELKTCTNAVAVFDLLFENNESRITDLKFFLPRPVFVHSILHTLNDIQQPFIRINAWPTFLKRSVTEASCRDESVKEKAAEIMQALGRKIKWVPDVPGFIAPRVVTMIINEAYFALAENVSTKTEIDLAMKLGTNYPFGPFEWAEKIGLKNIAELLGTLSRVNKRYEPAPLLLNEAALY